MGAQAQCYGACKDGIMSVADIKSVLEKMSIRPNPALGQNFLCDDAAVAAISAAAIGEGNLPMLEIGPGLGALTGALCAAAPRVTAVEIDAGMVAALNSIYNREIAENKLSIEHCDILKFDVTNIGEGFVAVGNLPYYITTNIALMLLKNACRIPRMVLMVQKEAARRFFAKPRTKLYGSLAIMAQLYYTPESILSLTPASYYPQPDVDSEVVLLTRRDDIASLPPCAEFLRFTESVFAMRRKTLYNNLKPLLPSSDAAMKVLEGCSLSPSVRAEELSIAELTALYGAIYASR